MEDDLIPGLILLGSREGGDALLDGSVFEEVVGRELVCGCNDQIGSSCGLHN